MPLASGFERVTITADGRYLVMRAKQPESLIVFQEFLAAGSLGGGTLTVEGSFEAHPDAATAAHWFTIADSGGTGLSIVPGRLVALQSKVPHLALSLAGSTSANITVTTG